MNKDVEKVRRVLEDDLTDNPYILPDPIGSALTFRKIEKYLWVCMISGISKPDSVDWLYNLYREQTDDERIKFQQRIDLVANTLYDFFAYIKEEQLIGL